MIQAQSVTGPEIPLISIVLPVRGVPEFLPACLDSVLADPAASLEVIAVDDASPDGCGRILDDWAAGNPRLRVIHLAGSLGPGPARMRGLAAAGGSYVWFVDPDDLLADGALAAIAARLASDRPDVLLIDYLIRYGSGRAEPSPGRGLLAAPGGNRTLTLAERPALADRTMTAWSKVFRRQFLLGLGICFPPGIHEDVPVSCAALLAAERIALLDRVCYLYRRRPRSLLATPSMGQFAIFSSYEQVFARLAASPGPAPATAVRAALFGRAIEHYSTVLAGGLVPRRARRAFFHRMASDFQRYRPDGYQSPPGARGLKIAVIERDAYLAYLLLAPLNRARVSARHALGRGKQPPRAAPGVSGKPGVGPGRSSRVAPVAHPGQERE
jgi:CDP-glycerol glycerophosphotransferase